MSRTIGLQDPAAQELAAQTLRASVFADLLGLGWTPIQQLLEAPPLPLPEGSQEVMIQHLRALFCSFTRNDEVAEKMDLPAEGMKFANFTSEILEPFIFHILPQHFEAAQAQLKY